MPEVSSSAFLQEGVFSFSERTHQIVFEAQTARDDLYEKAGRDCSDPFTLTGKPNFRLVNEKERENSDNCHDSFCHVKMKNSDLVKSGGDKIHPCM